MSVLARGQGPWLDITSFYRHEMLVFSSQQQHAACEKVSIRHAHTAATVAADCRLKALLSKGPNNSVDNLSGRSSLCARLKVGDGDAEPQWYTMNCSTQWRTYRSSRNWHRCREIPNWRGPLVHLGAQGREVDYAQTVSIVAHYSVRSAEHLVDSHARVPGAQHHHLNGLSLVGVPKNQVVLMRKTWPITACIMHNRWCETIGGPQSGTEVLHSRNYQNKQEKETN